MKTHVFEKAEDSYACKRCGLAEQSINHRPADKKEWVMPAWMEPYREHFNNTGGNSIEDLMNDEHAKPFSNALRATLIYCVRSQVALLNRLHDEGLLIEERSAVQ